VKEDEIGKASSTSGRRGMHIKILVENSEGKRPLGRQRRRSVCNIKMNLTEIGRGYMDWIDLAEGRGQSRALVNMVMNLRVV
jgi:hypothetical protein